MIKMNYIKSEEALMYKYRINAWAISGLCHLQTVVTVRHIGEKLVLSPAHAVREYAGACYASNLLLACAIYASGFRNSLSRLPRTLVIAWCAHAAKVKAEPIYATSLLTGVA